MKRIVVLLLGAALLGLQPWTPAQAAPRDGGTFNVPPTWGKAAANYRIIRSIEAAIDGTRPTAADPRPVIHVTTYFLDRDTSTDALVRACKRGVSVRVILDSGIKDRPARRLITALNADNVVDDNRDGKPDKPAKAGPCNTAKPVATASTRSAPASGTEEPPVGLMADQQAGQSVTQPDDRAITWGQDGSYVKQCQGSCRGGKGAMHSKFFVFSSTGGVNDVVTVSSSNLNKGGATRGWNDAITFTKRPKLRQGFVTVHRQMTEDVTATRTLTEYVDGNVTARFFPLRSGSRSNDPTLADLNKIRCTSAFGPTRIRVSMFYWAHTRGLYLADKLLSLARAGCKVSVIYGAPGADVRKKLMTAAKRGVISLYDSRRDKLAAGDYRVRTHGKFMLVQGTYAGDPRAYLTMTGSQNWAGSALAAGDEVTVNVRGSGVYREYLAHYDRIRKTSPRQR